MQQSSNIDSWSFVHLVFGVIMLYICHQLIVSFWPHGKLIVKDRWRILVLAVIIHQLHELFTLTSAGVTFWQSMGLEYEGNTNTAMDTIFYVLGAGATLMYTADKMC